MRRSRALRTVPLALLVLAALLAGVAGTSRSYSTDGPLQPGGGAGVEFPLPVDQAATWGMPLPFNETGAAITIESVEPLNPSGLEILAVLASYPDATEGITSALGFPPAGVATVAIEGAVLPVRGSPDEVLDVLIGVRRDPGAPAGTVEALRLRYEAGGRRFEVVFPWSLRIVAPPSST